MVLLKRSLLIALILAVLWFAGVCGLDWYHMRQVLRPPKPTDSTEQLIETIRSSYSIDSEWEGVQVAAQAYGILYDRLGRDGLDKLAQCGEPGVEMQAQWEKWLLQRYDGDAKVDPCLELETMITERLGQPPPERWSELLRSAKYYNKYDHFPVRFEHVHELTIEQAIDAESVYQHCQLASGTRVVLRGDQVVISVGDQQWTMEKHRFDEEIKEQGGNALALAGFEDLAFVACYSRLFPSWFWLSALRAGRGKRVWRSTCPSSFPEVYSGPYSDSQEVQIAADREKVMVFTTTNRGTCIDVFRTSDGTPLYRISTDYWYRRHEVVGPLVEERSESVPAAATAESN